MRRLLQSTPFLLTVAWGLASAFLFAMNEALAGSAKAKISAVLSISLLGALIAGFIFLGWKGFLSAGVIVLGGMLLAPLAYGAGDSLLRRYWGDF